MLEIIIPVARLNRGDLKKILPYGQHCFLGGITTFGNGSGLSERRIGFSGCLDPYTLSKNLKPSRPEIGPGGPFFSAGFFVHQEQIKAVLLEAPWQRHFFQREIEQLVLEGIDPELQHPDLLHSITTW